MSNIIENFVTILKSKPLAKYDTMELIDAIEETSIIYKYLDVNDKKNGEMLEGIFTALTTQYNTIRKDKIYKTSLKGVKKGMGSLSLKDI